MTITKHEYLLLGIELRNLNDIAKDQYKLFKNQINASNNNRKNNIKTEDGVKAEDGEVTENVNYRYTNDN